MNSIFLTLTLSAGSPPPSGGGLSGMLLPIVIMIAVFYFLIIRPQQKQRKQHEAKLKALQKGDQVITAGGMHASIHHISEKTVTLKLSEGIFVPFEKTSVQTVLKKSGAKDAAPKS